MSNGPARRAIPHARAWNIALRTAHIAAFGVLLGGHVFGVAPERLLPWLWGAIGSGALLLAVEAYPDWRWWSEGRGVVVLSKLALLLLIPWFWSYRVIILSAVLVIGSVGAHMPRRFRHYSWLDRRVIPEADSALTFRSSSR
jgi:hypothetical protein